MPGTWPSQPSPTPALPPGLRLRDSSTSEPGTTPSSPHTPSRFTYPKGNSSSFLALFLSVCSPGKHQMVLPGAAEAPPPPLVFTGRGSRQKPMATGAGGWWPWAHSPQAWVPSAAKPEFEGFGNQVHCIRQSTAATPQPEGAGAGPAVPPGGLAALADATAFLFDASFQPHLVLTDPLTS